MNEQSPTQAVLGTAKETGYVLNARWGTSKHNPVHALTYVLSGSKCEAYFKAYAEENGYTVKSSSSQQAKLEGRGEELMLWASPITIF